MIGPFTAMWLEYAEDLARHVNGWAGLREWGSQDGEMVIACSNEGAGIVRVVAGMGRLDHDEGCEASFDIRAAELARFREELRSFLGETT
jgi:hypothetical protein